MSYFTAVLAGSDDGYRALDIDVRDAADLDDLVDMMRNAGDAEGEAVAVVEHEDEWFAIVRVSSGDEVKTFISDLRAVGDSPFAEIFADYLDSRQDEYEEDRGDEVVSEDLDSDDEEDEGEVEMLDFDDDAEWGGDPDIFEDLGVTAEELIEQTQTHVSDPARVVAHIGEAVGFATQLEAAR